MTNDKIQVLLNATQNDYDGYLARYEENPIEESIEDMESRLYLEGYAQALADVLDILQNQN